MVFTKKVFYPELRCSLATTKRLLLRARRSPFVFLRLGLPSPLLSLPFGSERSPPVASLREASAASSLRESALLPLRLLRKGEIPLLLPRTRKERDSEPLRQRVRRLAPFGISRKRSSPFGIRSQLFADLSLATHSALRKKERKALRIPEGNSLA